MSKFLFLLVSIIPLAALANHIPGQSDKTFTVIVEAGAKLLEFDIVRETINSKEKSILVYIE